MNAPNILQIVEYDPRWPLLFSRERARVLEVVGEAVSTVYHLGSTSVPGLAAKPKIDMYFASSHAAPPPSLHQQILALGYTLSEHSGRIGHSAYNRDDVIPAYTIHWCLSDHPNMLRAKWFRDRLRDDAELRARYIRIKEKALVSCAGDRWAYNQHKAQFIEEVLSHFNEETAE